MKKVYRREDIIIKDVKNLFRLKKEKGNKVIENIRNLFRLKKENEAIKGKIIWDIKTIFKREEDHYKRKSVNSFWNYNDIKFEINGDRNKNLLVKEYLKEIKPYLKDVISDLQKSGTGKIQLTMAINNGNFLLRYRCILRVITLEIMTYDYANEVIEEIFESLLSK